ncbi:MAG: hypothetical protein HY794_06675 [Desulfarculus sp.]|nr:hypothetical protein [Desulfarculus sp.]
MKRPSLLSLALLGLLLAGCSLMREPAPPAAPAEETPAPARSQGVQLYEDAATALLSGRHATASAWFAGLAQSTTDPLLRRKARFGQAAAALAAARTPTQASKALELWRAWQGEAPPLTDQEDPRLLGPALMGLETCLASRPSPQARAEQGELQQRLVRLQEENQRLKKQLADLEALHKELSERKNRLGK